MAIFCSTCLPIASTRWVRLTLSSLCPVFYAVPSLNSHQHQNKNSWESNTGLLCEEQKCYLYTMQPHPPLWQLFGPIWCWLLCLEMLYIRSTDPCTIRTTVRGQIRICPFASDPSHHVGLKLWLLEMPKSVVQFVHEEIWFSFCCIAKLMVIDTYHWKHLTSIIFWG